MGRCYNYFNTNTHNSSGKKCSLAAVITRIETTKNVVIKQKFCQNMTTDILVLMSRSSQDQSYTVFKKGNLKYLGTLVTHREECHLLSQ